MHPYATDSGRERYAILAIAILSVLFAFAMHRLFQFAHFQPPWWLDTPAVLGFFGIVWKWYDRVVWHWRRGPLHVSDVPYLSGEWVGEVQSSHNSTRISATLTIHQTASHILIELVTENSRSQSVMATLNCKPGLYHGLHYAFNNHPHALNAPTMAPHRGQAHLRIEDGGMTLVGDYNTDQHRGNHGRMKFRRDRRAC